MPFHPATVVPDDVQRLVAAGALVLVNHSGGKDSQAMFLRLREIVPADQLVVVHAHLRGMDWPDAIDHIRATIGDTPLHIVEATHDFFALVRTRGMFPSSNARFCSKALKRGPLSKLLRRLSADNPRTPHIINCLGLRAQESQKRADRPVLRRDNELSTRNRTVLEWLPIHDLSAAEVFTTIAAAGQDPHRAYALGMSRFSCALCVMGRVQDHRIAARLFPALYDSLARLEMEIGFTMRPGRSLPDVTGVPAVGTNIKMSRVIG